MKHQAQIKLLTITILLSMCFITLLLSSCSNRDEPSIENPSQSQEKELWGSWVGEYSINEGDADLIMTSELTFSADGKMTRTITSEHFNNKELVGSQRTELPGVNYELSDGVLMCEGLGEYDIILVGNTLSVGLKEDSYRLWGMLILNINGNEYRNSPDILVYSRK